MTTPRVLHLLAASASPIFLAAAVAGWLYGVWPATPVTFAIAAIVVTGGPVLAIYHVSTAREAYEDELEEQLAVAEPAPLVLTPKSAAARAFVNWRDQPHPAIELRERERRANAFLRS